MIDYEYGIGDEFNEEAEDEKESYDWGRDTYDDSIPSDDWNFGTDYEDF